MRDDLRVLGTVAHRVCKERVAMHGVRQCDQAAPDAPEHPTRGLAPAERRRQVAFDALSDGQSLVPCAQHGEFIGVGKGPVQADFDSPKFSN